jgi:hypothetical protein
MKIRTAYAYLSNTDESLSWCRALWLRH